MQIGVIPPLVSVLNLGDAKVVMKALEGLERILLVGSRIAFMLM